ncbi:MAG: nucleotidyltransferase family protein [Candidatus Methanoperedens sp.]|nr:nucleotidyltransferase family protein [Candidatus Methanoperedens sp.]
MKALILAGGRGKRLEGVSDNRNKCMLELKGRPLIEHNLNNIIKLNINEIVIVVGYRAEDIINTYGIEYKGKKIKYVIQSNQHGLVHAIESSKEALGSEDFMLFLGDEILINPKHKEMIEIFNNEGLFGICGIVIEKDRSKIKHTYSIFNDEGGRIYRLIEKPRNPQNDMQGTGNCIFKNELLSYIEKTPINQVRGEKELPDLIQCAIDEGKIVKSFIICDKYSNINSEEDLKEVT